MKSLNNKILPTTVKSVLHYNDKRIDEIDKFINVLDIEVKNMIHLHACRGGPALSNEIYLSINEKKIHPELTMIWGLIHPFSPAIKYLMYWFGGLDKNSYFEALEKLIINDTLVVNCGELNYELLLNDADSLYLEKKHAIKILITPVIDKYGGKYLELLKIDKKELEKELLLVIKDDRVSIEKFFIEISKYLVNKLLDKYNLPTFEYLYIDSMVIKNYLHEGVKLSHWNRNYEKKAIKRERIIIHTKNEFKKRFQGYNKAPDLGDFEKIYDIFAKQKNRSTRQSNLNTTEILKLVKDNDLETIKNDHLELSNIIASTYSKSIVRKDYDIPFISGKDMIELCFSQASNLSTSVVLQRFFRPGGYEKYAEMIKKYPNVQALKPSVDIWDISKFPEYDTNLFLGLNYFK